MKNRDADSRRGFFWRAPLAGRLLYGLTAAGEESLSTQANPRAALYDLLVRGGRVVDPSQNLFDDRDITITAGRIVQVGVGIPESEARQVLNAKGKIVTPGLIDVHVHVYDGVAPLGIPADPNCIAKGVTTVVDAGSAGAHTFPGLRKYVIKAVDTRVYALLNIAVVGQSTYSPDNPFGELLDLRYANPRLTIRTMLAVDFVAELDRFANSNESGIDLHSASSPVTCHGSAGRSCQPQTRV